MGKNNLILSEKDYEDMDWHDCRIYGFIFDTREYEFYQETDLVFDIDYIAEWIKEPNSSSLSFKVAPCTLVFENIWDLEINIDTKASQYSPNHFEIYSLSLIDKELFNGFYTYTWLIELLIGKIQFCSKGYQQFMRQPPIKTGSQRLTMDERKGISFEKTMEI